MTRYTVTIEGLESGLVAGAVKSIVRDYFPDAEHIEVEEREL